MAKESHRKVLIITHKLKLFFLLKHELACILH